MNKVAATSLLMVLEMCYAADSISTECIESSQQIVTAHTLVLIRSLIKLVE